MHDFNGEGYNHHYAANIATDVINLSQTRMIRLA